MTFLLGGNSFEGAPLSNEDSRALSVHEIAGSDGAYVQNVGKRNVPLSIKAVLTSIEWAALKAVIVAAAEDVMLFSDDVTGITNIEVMVESYREEELAPNAWGIEIILIRSPLGS